VKAASAVQLAPNASCERRRDEFPAVTLNARAEEVSRLRAHPSAAASTATVIACSHDGQARMQLITTR
jgi:hypothetical protein